MLIDFNRPVISPSVPHQESLIFDGVNSLISDMFSYTVDRIMANGKCSLAALPFEKLFNLVGVQMKRTALELLNHISYPQSRQKTC